MKLHQYIELALMNAKDGEVEFDLKLNEAGEVDDDGQQRIKFKVIKQK